MCACGLAGEHMASPIIAFLAGAGTGYLKQRNIEEQRKRDAEDQQFRSEQREAWRKQQADADTLNGNLKNAQAPAEVVEGELGDQSAGPPVPATLRQPPAVASASAGMTPPTAGQSPADLPKGGAAAPAAAPPVFRMVAPGGVNKTFNSSAEAQAAAKSYSSPEALNARFVAAYREGGQLDKAQELEDSFKRGQMADLHYVSPVQRYFQSMPDQNTLLLIYFVAFFLLAFIFRSLLVYLQTGINPLVLPRSQDAYGYVGMAFKVLMLACAFVLIALAFYPPAPIWLGSISPLEIPAIKWVGWFALLVSLLWMLVAQAQMGGSWRIGIDSANRTKLVSTGLFSVSRNPIFLATRLALLGFFLVAPNAATLAILAAGEIVIQVQVRLEEQHLLGLHGASYINYCSQVPRWF